MNQQPIAEVNSHKHLGIPLNGECSWHEHLSELKSKAWQRINIMRKLKFILDRQSLQAIYFSFIRLLLEYADVVWDNCTQHEANEKIQTEAARVVTGATRLVSIDSLRTETRWETLASRRQKHKLLLFLARLFSKKTTRYCHSSGVVCVCVVVVQKLGHFVISLSLLNIFT